MQRLKVNSLSLFTVHVTLKAIWFDATACINPTHIFVFVQNHIKQVIRSILPFKLTFCPPLKRFLIYENVRFHL